MLRPSMSTAPRITPWDGDPAPLAAAMNAGFSATEALQETPDSILERLREGTAQREASFVAWDGDRVVGLLFGIHRSDGRAWAHGLTMIPEYRGLGLGRALGQRFIDEAQARSIASIHCEVLGNNEVALTLYRSLGFTVVRKLSSFAFTIPPASADDAGLVQGGVELLPAIDDRPARPLHRDRAAILRMPDVRVTIDPRTSSHVAWLPNRLLDVGGPIDDVVVPRLLARLPAGDYKIVGVPQEDQLHDVLRGLGMRIAARQVEVMRVSPQPGGGPREH